MHGGGGGMMVVVVVGGGSGSGVVQWSVVSDNGEEMTKVGIEPRSLQHSRCRTLLSQISYLILFPSYLCHGDISI